MNKFILEQQNENLKLDENLKLLTVDGDTVFAKKAIKKNSVVLRYSENNCRACIDAEYDNLKNIKSLITDQIYIIAYYSKIRDLVYDNEKLKRMGLGKIVLYLILDDNMGIPLDNNSVPFYFKLNSNMSMTNFFIPIKEQPKLSEYYLKYSLKKLVISSY